MAQRSFAKHAKSAFKKSLVLSFPEIAEAKDWRKRWIKIAVFAACLAGSSYQTCAFLKIYFAYPTVFDMQISRPTDVIQPAITFCNKNKRRRSVVCEKPECECAFNNKLSICADFPPACILFSSDSEKEVVYQKFPESTKYLEPPCLNLTWDAVERESHKNETIANCKMTAVSMPERNCSHPFLRSPTREPNHPYELNLCYTVESKVGEPQADDTMRDNTFYMSVLLDTHHGEYLSYDNLPRATVAFHDQRALVNPYKDGTDLTGGLRYTAYVSMKERRFLPSPYDTHCVDYLALWRGRNGTGPLNQKMCLEYCKMKSVKELGFCMDQNIIYPHEEKVCELGVTTLTADILKKCTKQCGNPCSEKSFEVNYEESGNFHCGFAKKGYYDNTKCKYQFIYLEAFFSRYTLTVISYLPKYESVEVLSYVGGYIGIWIGLSLVAIFDFLETLVHLAMYPFLARRKRSRKKAVPDRKRIKYY